MKLSDTAILKLLSTLAIAAALCVVGLFFSARIPVNLLPDITYPLVKVYVYWTGATPEEIEDNIADIIEPKMATVDDLDYLESNIVEGQYQLLVNFTYDADRNVAYQDVMAKMGLIRKKLPKDADEPLIIKADPSQLPVMDLLVTSKKWDMAKLRSWAENELQYEFSAVARTAGTEVSGGKIREIRVLLDPYRMQATGVTIEKVAQRLREENLELAAGRVVSGRKDFTVCTLSRFKTIDEIASIVIEPDKYGASILLKDVAKVRDAAAVQRIITRIGNVEGVKISVFKQAASGKSLLDAVVTATSLRLRPILMTFLTDVLGLMPFLLNLGKGTEMLRPLGVAVIGSITWSLTVTFVFVPVIYYVMHGKRRNSV